MKKSPWVICKILGLFLNVLSVDNKYSLLNRGNLLQHFQMQLSQKWKTFSQFFFPFSEFPFNFEHFPKKMTCIADVFFNFRTPKHVTRYMSKKSCFRGPFDMWHGKPAETLFKCGRQQLYNIYCSVWRQFRLKKSPWVICKTLGLFVNLLTADEKYSVLNRDNLKEHIRIQFSQKRKIFSNFTLHFLNIDSLLNIF